MCDENSVTSSNNVELKSVSVVSLKFDLSAVSVLWCPYFVPLVMPQRCVSVLRNVCECILSVFGIVVS